MSHSAHETLINSGQFTGMDAQDGREAIVAWLDREGIGNPSVNYKLRDWLISRQRYWGCPIPIIYCQRCGMVPVPEDELPVKLPEIRDYQPKGMSPLAAAEDWVNTKCPSCDGKARRETDTMDTFVDSSWYFLRYCDARDDERAWDRRVVDMWMPVDQYIGGRRARDSAPDVLAVLCQSTPRHGAARLRGAVPRAVHAGHDPRQRWQQDVQLEGQCGRATRDRRARSAPTPPARTCCSWAPPSRTPPGRTRASRAPSASYPGCGDSATSSQRTGGSEPGAEPPQDPRGADEILVRKANWAIDKVTRDMTGTFGFNTAIAAVMELVNEVYRHPDADAGSAPVRDRDRGIAGVPVRAAPRRRGVRAADRRPGLGGAVAGRRSGHAPGATRSSSSARSTARSATA